MNGGARSTAPVPLRRNGPVPQHQTPPLLSSAHVWSSSDEFVSPSRARRSRCRSPLPGRADRRCSRPSTPPCRRRAARRTLASSAPSAPQRRHERVAHGPDAQTTGRGPPSNVDAVARAAVRVPPSVDGSPRHPESAWSRRHRRPRRCRSRRRRSRRRRRRSLPLRARSRSSRWPRAQRARASRTRRRMRFSSFASEREENSLSANPDAPGPRTTRP